MPEPHIYADGQIGIGQLLLCLHFTGKDDVPAIALTLDRGSLGLPDHGPILLDLDMADLWQDHSLVFDRDGRLALELLDLEIGEAIIAIMDLQPMVG